MQLFGYDLKFGGESIFRDADGEPAVAVSVESPEAARIADLLVLRQDMGETIARCEGLLAASDAEDVVGVGAFYESMLIAYGRCFGKGKSAQGRQSRRQIRHLLDALTPEMRDTHDNAINLRNKWIAHRVDGQEGVKVVATFKQTGEFLGATAVSSMLSGNTQVARDLMPVAQTLADALSDLIDEEIDALEAKMREQEIALLPPAK